VSWAGGGACRVGGAVDEGDAGAADAWGDGCRRGWRGHGQCGNAVIGMGGKGMARYG